MGVLEIHLHDPSFELSVGDGDGRSLGLGGTRLRSNGGTDEPADDRPPIAGKLLPLLVVLAAVALTVLRNQRRRSRGQD